MFSKRCICVAPLALLASACDTETYSKNITDAVIALGSFPKVCPSGFDTNVSPEEAFVTFIPKFENRGAANSNIPFQFYFLGISSNIGGGGASLVDVPGGFSIPGTGAVPGVATGPQTPLTSALIPVGATFPYKRDGKYSLTIMITHSDVGAFTIANADCSTYKANFV